MRAYQTEPRPLRQRHFRGGGTHGGANENAPGDKSPGALVLKVVPPRLCRVLKGL